MNETELLNPVGDYVRYLGGSRASELKDRIGTIAAVRYGLDNKPAFYGVDYPGNDVLVWATVSTWEVVKGKTFDIEDIFIQAAGGPLAVAKAEIERLEARIAELKAAVKVIESL
jgi:hypothetical protein